MQFIFEHNPASIRPFVLKTIHYIQEQVIARPGDNEQFLNRCKFIITELCTNAIKHSGQGESVFNIHMHNNRLIIERTDTGNPFYVSVNEVEVSFPLPRELNILTLTEDDINRLNIQRIHDYSARFYAEQVNKEKRFTEQKLNEHFGLVIICLSADSFVYTHHPESGHNIFTAVIELS